MLVTARHDRSIKVCLLELKLFALHCLLLAGLGTREYDPRYVVRQIGFEPIDVGIIVMSWEVGLFQEVVPRDVRVSAAVALDHVRVVLS